MLILLFFFKYVLLLQYICPKKICPPLTIYLSSYYYICVLILLYVSSYYYVCVLILLNMCPHTPVFKGGRWVGESRGEMERKFNRSSYSHIRVSIYVSSYCYICVLILLCMCPHTAICVSSYYYTFVLILLCMCPHTTIYVSAYYYKYVSSYYYICVLIPLHICPHTTTCVSS